MAKHACLCTRVHKRKSVSCIQYHQSYSLPLYLINLLIIMRTSSNNYKIEAQSNTWNVRVIFRGWQPQLQSLAIFPYSWSMSWRKVFFKFREWMHISTMRLISLLIKIMVTNLCYDQATCCKYIASNQKAYFTKYCLACCYVLFCCLVFLFFSCERHFWLYAL